MADTKITSLLTPQVTTNPATDVLPIVNIADTSMASSGSTRKITVNTLLGSGGTATLASATITGDLTVDTSTLYVSSSTDKVCVGTTSPSGEKLTVAGNVSANAWVGRGNIAAPSGDCSIFRSADNTLSFGIASTTAMTLNANGLGLGVSPITALSFPIGTTKIVAQSAVTAHLAGNAGTMKFGISDGGGDYSGLHVVNSHNGTYSSQDLLFFTGEGGVSSCTERMRITRSGNVGIGVTPSAWGSNFKVVQVGQAGSVYGSAPTGFYGIKFNLYNDNTNDISITNNFVGEYRFNILNGSHIWFNKSTSSGGVGVAQTLTQAMTLDASGNLLVGTTTGSRHCIYKSVAAGSIILDVQSPTTAVISTLTYAADASGASAANTVFLAQKNNATSRSINAAGTVNASGADYAEYMTKASDFVLSKGGIAGIDANGKLTNVFADAISFVVKSTDPSYVGNDKWGVDLEGDALEAARQLVDRIAFAGQVPVNVIGAKAGDYIVPVVDGTGIKGIAVTSPTFEQYQIAVGKVIAIDADGRARIIVKVA